MARAASANPRKRADPRIVCGAGAARTSPPAPPDRLSDADYRFAAAAPRYFAPAAAPAPAAFARASAFLTSAFR
ncbi:hypothetical protein BOC40_03510 [Burkholderia pseudomallei]|nr:hypothetical protein BOC40_03510 [Burkholderia pseudomallei]ARL46832.1 hypothetical protein BOC50_28405 [Burkholderia pseudomallei]